MSTPLAALISKNLLLGEDQKTAWLSELKQMDTLEETALTLILEQHEEILKNYLNQNLNGTSLKTLLALWQEVKHKTTQKAHNISHENEAKEAEKALTLQLS